MRKIAQDRVKIIFCTRKRAYMGTIWVQILIFISSFKTNLL